MEGKVIRTKVPIAKPGVISIIEDTEEVYICFEDGTVKKLVSATTTSGKPADFLYDQQTGTYTPVFAEIGGYSKIVYSDTQPQNPKVGTIWVKSDGQSYIYDGQQWSKINRISYSDIQGDIPISDSLNPFSTDISFTINGLQVSWGSGFKIIVHGQSIKTYNISPQNTPITLNQNSNYYIYAILNSSNNTATISFSTTITNQPNTILLGTAVTTSNSISYAIVGQRIARQTFDSILGTTNPSQIPKGIQQYVSNITITQQSPSSIQCSSGQIIFSDGTTYSVSQTTLNLTSDGWWYVYFEIQTTTANLYVTQVYSDAVSPTRGILAICYRSSSGISIFPISTRAGVINSDVIAAGAITSSHIQANSISSSHIQANAITTSHIQANSITADKLAIRTTKIWYSDNLSFSIVSSKIRATFNSLAIYTGTETPEATAMSPIDATSNVSDGVWYLWYDFDGSPKFKIDTSSVVSNNFKANEDLLITKIIVSSGEISQVIPLFNGTLIDGATIKSDTIEGRHIKANTISADKIAVGTFGNLLPYVYATFEGINVNRLPQSGYPVITTTSNAVDGSTAIQATLLSSNWFEIPMQGDLILARPNQQYTFSFAAHSTTPGAQLTLEVYQGSTLLASQTYTLTTSYSRYSIQFTTQSSVSNLKFRFRGGSTTSQVYRIDACQLEFGFVSNPQYSPPAITFIDGSMIQTGTINSSHIQSNSITADRLNVSQLSAITANLGTITSGRLFSTTIAVPKVTFDDNGNLYYVKPDNSLTTNVFEAAYDTVIGDIKNAGLNIDKSQISVDVLYTDKLVAPDVLTVQEAKIIDVDFMDLANNNVIFQSIIDNLGVFLNGDVTIRILADNVTTTTTNYDDVSIDGFIGPGKLDIVFTVNNSANASRIANIRWIGYWNIRGCNEVRLYTDSAYGDSYKPVLIRPFSLAPATIRVYRTNSFELGRVIVDCVKDAQYCLFVESSGCFVHRCTLRGATDGAIYSGKGAQVGAYNLSGTNGVSTSDPAVSFVATNGGIIIAQGTVPTNFNGQYTKSSEIGFIHDANVSTPTTSTPITTPTTYTRTLYASKGYCWNTSYGLRSDTDRKVGSWGYGYNTSWFFFPQRTTNSLTKASITLKRMVGAGSSASQTVHIFAVPYNGSAAPTSWNYGTSGAVYLGSLSLAQGEQKTLTITNSSVLSSLRTIMNTSGGWGIWLNAKNSTTSQAPYGTGYMALYNEFSSNLSRPRVVVIYT